MLWNDTNQTKLSLPNPVTPTHAQAATLTATWKYAHTQQQQNNTINMNFFNLYTISGRSGGASICWLVTTRSAAFVIFLVYSNLRSTFSGFVTVA